MNTRFRPVNLAVRALLAAPAAVVAAEPGPAADDPLPTLYISATAIREDARDLASSFSVLDEERLLQRTRATLGDTLAGIPGVRSDTFGGGASRPVIRGQGAPRVKVLSDSASLMDASDISPDHAVTAEPLLVDRIEVLRGPATLLYGSGAIGGVVNLLDDRIPEGPPVDGVDGAVAARGDSAARERAAAAELTARVARGLVFHVEGTTRDADDYRVPGPAGPRVEGSRARSASGSAGLSWVGARGYVGLAYSLRDDDYGLPGHAHEYEGCHPHDSLLHCGGHEAGEDEHDHEGEEMHGFPVIDLVSRRLDLRAQVDAPFPGVEGIRVRATRTDYRHHEIEEGEIATTFRTEGYEARLEVQHARAWGWRGVVGAQFGRLDIRAEGGEAFLPTTRSHSLGLFAVEHREIAEALHLEFGARQEWQVHRPVDDPRGRPRFSDSAFSVSGAAVWEFVPDHRLTLSLARSERMPHAQELYARGIHLATNTYECGLVPHPQTCGGPGNDAPLEVETSSNAELSLRRSAGRLNLALSAWYNRVDDYIHARTLDRFGDFRLIKYAQRDADFRGFEAEATWRFSEALSATVFGDHVRARFDDRSPLPRIPAARLGARLNARTGPFDGELEYYRAGDHDEVAEHEFATPSHHMLNLTVGYAPRGNPSLRVFLRGTNLLDEEAWNPTSFLANVVPLPGRNLALGMKLSF